MLFSEPMFEELQGRNCAVKLEEEIVAENYEQLKNLKCNEQGAKRKCMLYYVTII